MSTIEVSTPQVTSDFYIDDPDKRLKFGFEVTREGNLIINRVGVTPHTPYAAYPEGFWVRVQTTD